MSPQRSVFPNLTISLFVLVSMFFYRNGEAMKPAEQYNYSLASSAVPLSNECKSISRQSLYRDKENADDRCLQAFAFLDQARYNVCNGYSEAKCRFIPLPSSTSTSCGTYLCTAVVSNVIKSFEDCAPALGLPTFGEGSTSSTGGDGSSRLLCFASAKRLQIGEVGKKRRVSPPPPFPTLNSSWGAQSFGSSSVKRSNTRPTYAGPTSQGISSIPPPPPAIMDPSWGPQTFAGSSSVKRADYPSRYTYPTTQGGESQERTPFQCYKCKKYYKTQAILELHFRTHKEGQSSSRRTSPPGGQSSSRRTSPPGGQSSSRRTSPPGGQYPQDPSGLIQDPTFGVADLDGADSQYTMFFQPGTSQTGSEAGHFRGSSGLDEAAKRGRPLAYPPGTMCLACNKDFHNRMKLINHIKKEHEGATTCPICQQVCSSTSALTAHKKKIHKIN